MGFLTNYDGVDTVQIPTHDGKDWWVKVKKCLSEGEDEQALEAMNKMHAAKAVDRIIDGFMVTYLFEQTLLSVTDWNLTGLDDQLLPLDHDPEKELLDGRPSPRRRSLKTLPSPVFDQISKVVRANNRPQTREEAATFPEVVDGGVELGADDASDDPQVLEGGPVLEGVGGPSGPQTVE